MDSLTNDEKLKIVSDILTSVDNVNIILETPNYVRKYGEINYDLEVLDNELLKRYLITNREKFRKILLADWVNSYFTTSQVQDISNTLSLVRQKISQLFTN